MSGVISMFVGYQAADNLTDIEIQCALHFCKLYACFQYQGFAIIFQNVAIPATAAA
jgi:hypothetical protein